MLKAIFKTLFSISISGSGFYTAYLYLSSIDSRNNPILLLISVTLVTIGIFLLFKIGSSDATVAAMTNADTSNIIKGPLVTDQEGLASTLAKNNKLVGQWADAATQKDKMRLLEISAAAEEQKE
jgi:hypothetical protein